MKTLFFCGIGGSGMSALAQYVRRRGARVTGSDRGFDQSRNLAVRNALAALGITIVPQDGQGVTGDMDTLVVSSAVEPTIPDVAAAQRLGIPIMTRAELLADVFGSFPTGVAVAGTSGKSTVTAMLAHILIHEGRDPTVINGAVMAPGLADPGIGNVRTGQGNLCLIEADESDGSIANYTPEIGVLTNMGLDHKTWPELRELFGAFVTRAETGAVLNADCPESIRLPRPARVVTFGLRGHADLKAEEVSATAAGMRYRVNEGWYTLPVPGTHNVANGLAAAGAATLLGIPADRALQALQTFGGVQRRLQTIGTANGIRVIDDFAHNPDKVTASLSALRQHDGRLHVCFQPHGFAPLRLFLRDLAQAFADGLNDGDRLVVAPVFYAGGTVSRQVSAEALVEAVRDMGGEAHAATNRADALAILCADTHPGDRIVVMGARDDTLTEFCHEILAHLAGQGEQGDAQT